MSVSLETQRCPQCGATGTNGYDWANIETSVPPVIRTALLVLLNHIEPGWGNCETVVRQWLDTQNAASGSNTASVKPKNES
jgi:hypothetical protein